MNEGLCGALHKIAARGGPRREEKATRQRESAERIVTDWFVYCKFSHYLHNTASDWEGFNLRFILRPKTLVDHNISAPQCQLTPSTPCLCSGPLHQTPYERHRNEHNLCRLRIPGRE